MLKQKPLSYYQSSIFTKKPKKRSTSTSANKENLSITHNNSIIVQPNSNINSKANLNSKSIKNPNTHKEKSRKTKKSQTHQKSTSKLPLTSNLVHEKDKQVSIKLRQSQPHLKKIKKSRNNSSSMIYAEKDNKSYTKNFLNQKSQLPQMKNKQVKYSNVLNSFNAEMSKSSTIVSSSTGNIQFSEWSREDQHDKNCDLLSINHLMNFNRQVKSSQSSLRDEYVVKSARQKVGVSKYKLTSTKAAIMIQKTWRGYLTRKLLSEYIDSFEPLYQEQLKDIRSGRQSRHEAKQIIFSNKKCHQKSSFFDKSQLEECSEIQPIESHISQSFRTTNKLHNQTSSLLFTQNQNNQIEHSSLRDQSAFRQSGNILSSKIKGNQQYCDLPVQFFKKKIVASTTKREEEPLMTSKNDDFSCSSRRKNAMKITPQTASRVSEFTVKHPTNTAQNTSKRQQSPIQQTLKYPHSYKPSNLSICPKTTTLSISPQNYTKSPIDQMQIHCKSLSTLFHSFNSMCISDLKTQIKMNNLTVNELMERKDALKDIVDNGMEFVKNVEEQIAKAFKEMKRLVREGCDSSSDRDNRVYGSSSQSQIDSSTQRSDIPRTINSKNQAYNNKFSHKQSPTQKISNEKYIDDLQSPAFSYDSQIDSSSSRKQHKGNIRYNTKGGTSQFYTIDLPTEEYSAKGKSPIQQDCDEQDESYREEDYEGHDTNSQQHEAHDNQDDQQEYTQRTLRMNPLYSSHQQSLQIMNQFLLNLKQEYQEMTTTTAISQLQYLCQTLKRVSCDSQNKTIIDRCLIEFIVQIMSETWTLKQIYEGFKKIIHQGIIQNNEDNQHQQGQQQQQQSHQPQQQKYQQDWKLLKTIRKWIQQLYKWQMNIIQEVPSKMQSSSFINTQNLSLNQLRQAVNNLPHPGNFQLDLNYTHYK